MVPDATIVAQESSSQLWQRRMWLRRAIGAAVVLLALYCAYSALATRVLVFGLLSAPANARPRWMSKAAVTTLLQAIHNADAPKRQAAAFLRAFADPLAEPSTGDVASAASLPRVPLACDAGDGLACNLALPPTEQLRPFRTAGCGPGRCARQSYPPPYEYQGLLRTSTYPLLSCDAIREVADHMDLEDPEYDCPVEPAAFRCGDTLFYHYQSPESLDAWFADGGPHSRIASPYLILACGSDIPAPPRVATAVFDAQTEPKLWAWFGNSVGAAGSHPRAFSIPLGTAPAGWPHGDMDKVRASYLLDPAQVASRMHGKLASFLNGTYERTHAAHAAVFAAFSIETNPAERTRAAQAAERVSDGLKQLPWEDYIAAMRAAVFVLAPAGNGMDVHRIEEALLSGSIPVVEEHTFPDGFYEGVPLIQVPSWEQLSMGYLRLAAEGVLARLADGRYDFRRLYAPYHIARIRREQQRAWEWCRGHGHPVHEPGAPRDCETAPTLRARV